VQLQTIGRLEDIGTSDSHLRIGTHLSRLAILLLGVLLLAFALFVAVFPQAYPSDGFGPFAQEIAHALATGDNDFFTTHRSEEYRYSSVLVLWLQAARSDLSDAYGDGAPRLHAVSCQVASDVAPHECLARSAVVTAIQDTPVGPERQVRVLGWRKFGGEWQLVFNLMPINENGPGKTPADWLTGGCDTCGSRWLRWQ
jgi:hypothetical protein